MPKVSIVMPVYNGAKHIRESMDSIVAQTFMDWEFLVINEFGSDDGSAEIVKEYEEKDERFRLIQNTERLGLAESLNLGFRLAQGEYIARLDADDLAHPERLEKQVKFMDDNKDIGICGTYQHHFGENIDWVHRSPVTPEACKARLLFNCVLCHSTLMLRRKTVMENELFYDNHFLAEDYELWCRASIVTKIANIPEILGEYRWDGTNITAAKKGKLDIESGKLVARNLKRNLDIELTDEECELFQGWDNPFGRYSGIEKEEKLDKLQNVLKRIYFSNKPQKVFDEKELLSVLACKWYWAKNNAPWDAEYDIQEISQIFSENYKPSFIVRYRNFCAHNKSFISKIKKIGVVILRPLARPFRRRLEAITWNSVNNVCSRIEDNILQQMQKKQDDLIDQIERLTALQDKRIEQAERLINQTMDERVWKSEQIVNQTIDERIWKAEQLINQTMDGRIWKAEQFINHTMDGRIWKAEQLINQTMDGRIWKMEQGMFKMMVDVLEFKNNQKIASDSSIKRIFLIGTSEHSNIGDAAIAVGEKEFIKQYFSEYELIEIPFDQITFQYDIMISLIGSDDLIFLQGGGNLGSRYPAEEDIRRKIITSFPQNQIVIMPQTIYFEQDDAGEKELNISKTIYNSHDNLLLLTRGNESSIFAQKHFTNVRNLCVPDMALMIDRNYGLNRNGILLCIRDLGDESGLTDTAYNEVIQIVKLIDDNAEITNNLYRGVSDSKIYSFAREQIVEQELRRFASHKVVVTDRLHGLIFALITHTPCVVISSYNYKIPDFIHSFIKSEKVFFVGNDLSNIERTIRTAFNTPVIEGEVINKYIFEKVSKIIRMGK